QKRYGEAEQLFERSLRAFTAELGPTHPKVTQVSQSYEEARRLARIAAAAGPMFTGGLLAP
ncbi:MAG: tetratricopeptide repeat protein, partial [Planctomycetales bacterium]|nr:tetratricopeptide repeat protein [Planctomycetales bacterium]